MVLHGLTKKDHDRAGRVVRQVERQVSGPQRNKREMPPKAAGGFIAKVDSDAAGGGYYNCHLQTLDADNWGTDTDLFENTGDSVVVLNTAEVGSSVHNLDAGDYIICRKFTDDESNARYVGNEVFGRHTFGEWE